MKKICLRKIEKVSRDIQGEKARKHRANLPEEFEHNKVPKGDGYVRVKRSLLEYHTRRKCSMEISRNAVKVKFGIKVIKLL